MTDNNSKMQEYGYYEVYVPVWNPEKQNRPINMTIDIYGDEELLDNLGIGTAVREYGGSEMEEMSEYERIIGNSIHDLIENNLIMEVYCDEFNIFSVRDLEERLTESHFEVFPL